MSGPTDRHDKASATDRSVPSTLALYVAAVIVVGGLTIVSSIVELPSTPRPLEWLLFAVLGVVAGIGAVKIPGVNALISVSDTFFLASAMLFGPAPAMLALAVDSAALAWRRGYGMHRLLFNAAAPSLSLWAAAHLFFALSGTPPLRDVSTPIAEVIPSLMAMMVVYFGLNSGLTAGAIALESGASLFDVWRKLTLLSVNYVAATSAAFCLVIMIRYAGVMAASVVLPLVLVFQFTLRTFLGRLDDAQQHAQKMDKLYLSTVETLAAAIEAKDGVTHDHIRRVQAYAVGLARVLGVNDEPTIKAIQAAALLHDTGKLAIPEHILNKPGKLSAAEFDQMKLHVDVGADLLSAIDFPYPVVPIVRAHHENWDGSGYPRGITGVDIPIGARILSVVDCFDALTSDRPYRPALSDEAALKILVERRGTMYDPLVVDTFLRVYTDIAPNTSGSILTAEVLATISRAAAPPPPAVPASAAVAGSGDAPDDLEAIIALSKMAQGEVAWADAALLASRALRGMVPESTCAFYVYDRATGRLVMRHASGEHAVALQDFQIPMGQRLTGWVAAHRQTMINSDAALDLHDRPAICGSALSTPLLFDTRVVGVLTAYATPRQAFTDAQARLFERVAPHLARIVAALLDEQPGERVRTAAASSSPQLSRVAGDRRDLRVVFSRDSVAESLL